MNDEAKRPVIQPTDFSPLDASNETASTLKPYWFLLGGVAFLLLVALFYVFTARSVTLTINPFYDELEVSGGLAFKVGGSYLLRAGEYRVTASAKGYYPLDVELIVSDDPSQTVAYELTPLPGIITFDVQPEGADIFLLNEEGAEELLGQSPIQDQPVPAGEQQLILKAERYRTQQQLVNIEGRERPQSFSYTLEPAWADISFKTAPAGATILVDGENRGQTPAQLELLEGEREVVLQLSGFQDWQQTLQVEASQPQTFDDVQLLPIEALLRLSSSPKGANVTLNGQFVGQAPLSLNVVPDRSHRIEMFKEGFNKASQQVKLTSGQERSLALKLKPVLAAVSIVANPTDAIVFQNNQRLGPVGRVYQLPAFKQRLEIRRQGYVTHTADVVPRPGIQQRLDVKLKTVEQARWEQVPRTVKADGDMAMVLMRPGRFTMGASRREPGRRSNEVKKEVELTRPFYIADKEVSNAQFRRFMREHNSGQYKGYSLDLDELPAVSMSWQQAAAYCNWLSKNEGLPLFYKIEEGQVTGINPQATGYRLPTEAEWAWSARVKPGQEAPLKFSWGSVLTPPANAENIGDRSAAFLLGRVLADYDDGKPVSAPVGSFAVNAWGLYDMGGNVAEWVNDYYGTQFSGLNTLLLDPLGPVEGKFRVIKGPSWAHGGVSELRLSYRDFSDQGRNDVGFRVARYVF